jgi:uncharacterized protein (UPF0264 family)
MAGLLVSVRDASEVAAALEGGASLIDVKEPALGALGRADDDVREAILDAVGGRVPVSAALGELLEVQDDGHGVPLFVWAAPERIDRSRLAYVKYGLNHTQASDWRSALAGRRGAVETETCRLVVTAYADWEMANSPPPAEVIQFAIQQRAAALLIDTWEKTEGRTLLDCLSVGEVADLSWRAWTAGVRVALAGSLGVEQIRALRVAAPDWFAVRGAACERGARGARIDAKRVRQLAEAAR